MRAWWQEGAIAEPEFRPASELMSILIECVSHGGTRSASTTHDLAFSNRY
jgi:hypothetical protein